MHSVHYPGVYGSLAKTERPAHKMRVDGTRAGVTFVYLVLCYCCRAVRSVFHCVVWCNGRVLCAAGAFTFKATAGPRFLRRSRSRRQGVLGILGVLKCFLFINRCFFLFRVAPYYLPRSSNSSVEMVQPGVLQECF